MDTPSLTAAQLAMTLKGKHPGLRFAYSANGSGVAEWDGANWVAIIERAITDQWIYTGGSMPLVNGRPVVRQWTEVQS